MKKSIFEVLSKHISNSVAQEIVDPTDIGENYGKTFGKNFKVILFGAFLNEVEFLGLEIVKQLYNINKRHNLNLFDMVIRLSDKGASLDSLESTLTTEIFDEKFVKSRVNYTSLSRVWICGPPGMNNSVPKALELLGVSRSKICIV